MSSDTHVTSDAVTLECTARPCDEALARWDALVAATPGTDVTQLSVWARVRAVEGFRPWYVLAHRNGRLVGGAQILLRRIPALGLIGYVPYGPLTAAGTAGRDQVHRALAGALASLDGVRMLVVQPPEDGDDVRAALLDRGFRPSTPPGIAPAGSVRLDLGRSEDDLLRRLQPRLRSRIRHAGEHGVRVRMGDAGDVPVLARLVELTAETRGFRPPSPAYLGHLYAELARTGNAALFIGEVRGVAVSADVVTMCGAMVRGRLGGFDRSGDGARLGVPSVARWEIARWAQRSGYRWLDFGGLSEQTLHDALDEGIRSCGSWPGADQAKMHFGGVPFRYPAAVELIRPPLLRHVYDAVAGSELGRSALHRAQVLLRHGRHPLSSVPPAPVPAPRVAT